ncbi:MAG: hypothetical protein ONB44_13305 [candidate division KSB1 bacterium]|nr:hypothetical protein [candidate division KSB1 bacterium]MDZ7303099.1 hypothetical protein [candidate division KSB1 bacterium]MDZ7312638.1 hypothetical protein [candidate division KSB1 bacterium]
MAFKIRKADYFYTIVKDQPGEAYRLLSQLASLGINLLAFAGMPMGPIRTQLTLFPEDTLKMQDAAKKAGLTLDGPYHALLVQGDDELGALAKIHMKLYEANVNVYASSGVADGQGSYGYILYVRPDEYERAVEALGV